MNRSVHTQLEHEGLSNMPARVRGSCQVQLCLMRSLFTFDIQWHWSKSKRRDTLRAAQKSELKQSISQNYAHCLIVPLFARLFNDVARQKMGKKHLCQAQIPSVAKSTAVLIVSRYIQPVSIGSQCAEMHPILRVLIYRSIVFLDEGCQHGETWDARINTLNEVLALSRDSPQHVDIAILVRSQTLQARRCSHVGCVIRFSLLVNYHGIPQ